MKWQREARAAVGPSGTVDVSPDSRALLKSFCEIGRLSPLSLKDTRTTVLEKMGATDAVAKNRINRRSYEAVWKYGVLQIYFLPERPVWGLPLNFCDMSTSGIRPAGVGIAITAAPEFAEVLKLLGESTLVAECARMLGANPRYDAGRRMRRTRELGICLAGHGQI